MILRTCTVILLLILLFGHTKFLGVYIDGKLCWKFHVNYVSIKVSKIVGIITNARHFLELKNLKELYNIMVYLYLTNCNINWESTCRTRIRSIYIAQKKIVRLMTFSSFRKTSQPLFKLFERMNIYEINLYLIANFMYFHYYGKLPELRNK